MITINNNSGGYFNFTEFSLKPYSSITIDETKLALNTLRVLKLALESSKISTSQSTLLLNTYTSAKDISDLNPLYVRIAEKGVEKGVTPLDSNRLVSSLYLPSYVDDVIEYTLKTDFPLIGEKGKIYVETTGNTTYRWSGTAYIKITSGEVSSVAGRTGNVVLTSADVGLGNVTNTQDAVKSVLSATKLTTARTLGFTGDVIGSSSFDGQANISTTLTLNRPNVETKVVYNTSSPSIVFNNGTIQLLTLAANGILSCDVTNGQSVQIIVPATNYTLDLSAFTIANNFVSISSTTLNTLLVINVSGTKYLYGTNKG